MIDRKIVNECLARLNNDYRIVDVNDDILNIQVNSPFVTGTMVEQVCLLGFRFVGCQCSGHYQYVVFQDTDKKQKKLF